MVKTKNHNRGFTLVELVVSIAILALIIVAISGVMFSNNLIFRKTKADIDIQTIAQDTANMVDNDIMQAKFIYIEGVTSSTDLVFSPSDVGGNVTNTLSPIKCVNNSDFLLRKSGDYTAFSSASGLFFTETSLATKRNGLSATVASGETLSAREKFDIYYNKIRYMSPSELGLYKEFLSDVGTLDASTKVYSSNDLKNGSGGFKNIYVNKMIIEYLVPLDAKYYPGGQTAINLLAEDNRYDVCKVQYDLVDNQLEVSTTYSKMTGLNQTNVVYTDCLNYAKVSAPGAAPTDPSSSVSGFVAKVDSVNNAIQINMYFVKNGMRYNSENIVQFRNSYVVEDAN